MDFCLENEHKNLTKQNEKVSLTVASKNVFVFSSTIGKNKTTFILGQNEIFHFL